MPTVEKPDTELVPVIQPITPMVLLQMATSRDADIDKLAKLMELQMVWQANEARMAYVQAMSAFKSEPIVIAKDKTNKQYASRYSSIGNLVNTVTPFLSKHGLSAEWELEQADGIRVGCRITHCLGHSGETKWMKVPPDTSGAKNPLQQIKSAVTYAKISTFEMATGLASAEGNLDDDGNSSGGIAEDVVSTHVRRLEACATLVDLQKAFEEAYKAAGEDKNAAGQFIRARDKRKQEIRSSPPASPQRIADPLVVERLNWIEDAKDIKELQRIYDNALRMARAHGDTDFEARLLAAAKKRSEAISAGV